MLKEDGRCKLRARKAREGKNELGLSQMCEMCACWPLGRKIGKTRRQFGEAQRERGDLSSTETLSVKRRYGGDMLIDPWTKHGTHTNTHTHTHTSKKIHNFPKYDSLNLKEDPKTSQSWEKLKIKKRNLDGLNSMTLQMCARGEEKIAVYVTC